MKTLYLDCGMGAAGDMLAAALLELMPDREKVVEELNALGIPGVEIVCEQAAKCGIGGTHVSVRVHGEEESEEMYGGAHTHEEAHGHKHEHTHEEAHGHKHEHTHETAHDGHHHHSGLHDIEHIVLALPVSERIRKVCAQSTGHRDSFS